MSNSSKNLSLYIILQGAILLVTASIANLLMCYLFKYLDWGSHFEFTHNYQINVALRYALDLILSIACTMPLIWRANDAFIDWCGLVRFRLSYCLCHILLTTIATFIILPLTQLLWMDWISSSASVLWDEDPYVIRDMFRLCFGFGCFYSSLLGLLFAISPLDQWRRLILTGKFT